MAEKVWEGCDDLEVTDEMKLTISAQAALLLLGMPHDYFSQVPSIVIFPRSFSQDREAPPGRGKLLGQAQPHGAVFLSWEDALREGRNPAGGDNLVIHEFAHQLDFLDGYTNGMPDLRGRQRTLEWQQVMRAGFADLKYQLQSSKKTLLGSYAATNPTEFFSVVSEKFFLVPGQLREVHPDLYDVLAEYYCLEPLTWFEDPTPDADFADFQCPSCGGKFPYPRQGARFQECPKCAGAVPIIHVPNPVTKISFPIRTPRLQLRCLQETDDAPIRQILTDAENLRALGWNIMTHAQIKRWLTDNEESHFPQRDKDVYLAIQSADSEQVVGLAGLSFIDEECEQLRIQLLIQPKFRRKGYGLEVVRGMLAFGFGALALHRIVCECEPGNLAAQALFAKAGLRPEGESKLDRRVGSEWVSTSFFAILKQEFQPTQRFS
jgi:Mlc titration factor MtfA (ptsG expression regulator)/RimJ/RimL family protein N-acetyltransferase